MLALLNRPSLQGFNKKDKFFEKISPSGQVFATKHCQVQLAPEFRADKGKGKR
jgi:hypothetical protein